MYMYRNRVNILIDVGSGCEVMGAERDSFVYIQNVKCETIDCTCIRIDVYSASRFLGGLYSASRLWRD